MKAEEGRYVKTVMDTNLEPRTHDLSSPLASRMTPTLPALHHSTRPVRHLLPIPNLTSHTIRRLHYWCRLRPLKMHL